VIREAGGGVIAVRHCYNLAYEPTTSRAKPLPDRQENSVEYKKSIDRMELVA
jgi:hypothetical protein